MKAKNPIICAIDTADLNAAVLLARDLKGSVGAIKLGLEFFSAHGGKGVGKVAEAGLPIFLDLKFHDIPNTVAGAVKAVTSLGIAMLTIHASGGEEMMKAAKKAADDEAKSKNITPPILLGVTVLTSLDKPDMENIGFAGGVEDQVIRLAGMAKDCGLDGVVCSSHEISSIRKNLGDDIVLVVPGIRPEGSENGDQKRVLTPKEAIERGADYLVIGRPITKAASPKSTAREILESLGDRVV